MAELTNRVAQSGIITLDLERFAPERPIVEFDLKEFLFQGLILREKEFRTALAEHDWSQYDGVVLCVYCSTDAIIPAWAPMLVASHALSHANDVFSGDKLAFLEDHYRKVIRTLDIEEWHDARIVVKGCSKQLVPPGAYLELTRRLQPVVRSLMFGEPCSTVPVYKKAK